MNTLKEKLIEQGFEIMSDMETQFEKSIKLQEEIQGQEGELIKELVLEVFNKANVEFTKNGFGTTTIKIYNFN